MQLFGIELDTSIATASLIVQILGLIGCWLTYRRLRFVMALKPLSKAFIASAEADGRDVTDESHPIYGLYPCNLGTSQKPTVIEAYKPRETSLKYPLDIV